MYLLELLMNSDVMGWRNLSKIPAVRKEAYR